MKEMQLKITATVLLLVVAAAGQAAAGELSFDPDTSTVFTLDIFLIDVWIDEQDSIMGYDITVSFDGDILTPLGVYEGDLPVGSGHDTFFRWMNEAEAGGTITVNGSILGTTVSGPGVLFTISFRASAVGVSPLEFGSCRMRNGLNEDLTLTFDDGWVEVMMPIAVKGSSWGAIKSMTR